MDLTDPTHIGLILVIAGILGVAGGNLKAGVLEVSLKSTKGTFTAIAMLVIVVGLSLIVLDFYYFLPRS